MNQSYRNLIVAIAVVGLILAWTRLESEVGVAGVEVVSVDPNKVTVEYKCSEIQDYDNVPPEVVEECRKRFEQEYNLDKKPTI